jgi:hypothetical protein
MSSNTHKNLHTAVSVVSIVKSNDRNNEHKFSPTCLPSSYFTVCLSPFTPIQHRETDKTKENTLGLNLMEGSGRKCDVISVSIQKPTTQGFCLFLV